MKAAVLLTLLCLPAAAAPARRPARHRVKRAPEARLTDPTAVSWPRRLAPGRWTPEAADALERLLHRLGEGTTGYSTSDPPAAVFVLDDAALNGSPGGVLFARLVADAGFSFDAAFWRQAPPHLGGPRARAGWQSFQGLPRAVWPNDPHYLMYRKAFHGAYRSLCDGADDRTCARWRTALLTGLLETDLQRIARRVTLEALRRPLAPEAVGDSPDDPASLGVSAALRFVPEMLDLMRNLQTRGFDVWAFSASNQYAALEAARLYGIHPTRVVGQRQKVVNGRLTADILSPTPVGDGLAEAVTLFLGRPPVLAVGGPADAPLLDYDDGTGLRLLLSGGQGVPPDAPRKGWVVQPAFSPVSAPQDPPPSGPPAGPEAGRAAPGP